MKSVILYYTSVSIFRISVYFYIKSFDLLVKRSPTPQEHLAQIEGGKNFNYFQTTTEISIYRHMKIKVLIHKNSF